MIIRSAKYTNETNTLMIVYTEDLGAVIVAKSNADLWNEVLSSVTPEPFETDIKSGLFAALDQYRWEVETAGISVAGFNIPTRDRDKVLINGKITEILIKNLPDTDSFNFVLNGQDVEITVAQIKAIGVAIAEHVQSCVDAAATVRIGIESGAITDHQGVLAAFNVEMGA